MSERMTAERLAELRELIEHRRAAGFTVQFGADELLRELDATRADLAELVAALPKCDICNKTATRNGNEFARHLCDDSHGMWGAAPELPYAAAVRGLASRKGTG